MFEHIAIVILIIVLAIICAVYIPKQNTHETVSYYRLAGQRNHGDCSPSNEDITLLMTPSIGLPETVTVKDGETFLFKRQFQTGDSYVITQQGSVSGMTCTIWNPEGTFLTSDIVNVEVICSSDTKYTIGGSYTTDTDITITAIINPGLVDEHKITVDVTTGSGNFVFAETYPTGTMYTIYEDGLGYTLTNSVSKIVCGNISNIDVTYVQPPV